MRKHRPVLLSLWFWCACLVVLFIIAFFLMGSIVPALLLGQARRHAAAAADPDIPCTTWAAAEHLTRKVRSASAFAAKLRHADESRCFLVASDAPLPSDERLLSWLHAFGAQQFLDLADLINPAKVLFEQQHHLPSPRAAILAALRSLQWQSPLFGRSWREAALALRCFAALPAMASPKLPEEDRQLLFSAFEQQRTLFEEHTLARLTDLARSEVTIDLLERVRDALARMQSDVGALPRDDSTFEALDLLPLLDAAHLPAALADRWNGPYLSETSACSEASGIPDPWCCPIIATIEGDELTLTSLGRDCAVGGGDLDADLFISSHLEHTR